MLDKNGKEVMPIMGSYGIGIERILTAAVEQGNDENGFWLPPAIAPFEVVVAPVNVKDEAVRTAAEDIAEQLEAAGFDVMLDDRDERPGVKFKDADLVGIPFRITVGKKVTEGTVEVVLRSTREVRDVTITAIVESFEGVARPGGVKMVPSPRPSRIVGHGNCQSDHRVSGHHRRDLRRISDHSAGADELFVSGRFAEHGDDGRRQSARRPTRSWSTSIDEEGAGTSNYAGPGSVTVQRIGTPGAPAVYVAADYSVPVSLPGYSFTLHFTPSSGNRGM